MIIGNPYQIAIQVEQIDVLCSPSGIFNFIINDMLIPGKGVTIDLYIVISSLKESLEIGLKEVNDDIGNVTIEKMDFSEGMPENLIPLNVAELYDYGCNFWLGFDGDEDRLIYTLDFENSFIENRFPRGTIEKLIRTLPLADSLLLDKNNDIIITKIS
ncbi:immunity 42 family protein [Enterobacteriaceae bacterium H20N1]|uniref:Immunity 42 family protein n=1 Tax=Dryocola boscaweniae TaxID=2925397 RepID=A0A9X3AC04_9ENTR|nr:Imm42 family immunity protein [Dryocola boscaweniae]MCT4701373.1 immunity 42 family protein [Dryocola boscaweniae]MCT4718716.1 immunity 42 family protein [Dryocola boscaweniae]